MRFALALFFLSLLLLGPRFTFLGTSAAMEPAGVASMEAGADVVVPRDGAARGATRPPPRGQTPSMRDGCKRGRG
eukprot:6250151-Pyramimonas_sp.AAC.1